MPQISTNLKFLFKNISYKANASKPDFKLEELCKNDYNLINIWINNIKIQNNNDTLSVVKCNNEGKQITNLNTNDINVAGKLK